VYQLDYIPNAFRVFRSRHGTHGHWYSTKHDCYVPIPEEDLAAKRRRVREGQAHRKHHVDLADVQEQAFSLAEVRPRQRSASGGRSPDHSESSVTLMAPPPESSLRVTHAGASRCVMVCTTLLSRTTDVPPLSSRSEGSVQRSRPSSSEGTSGFAPPAKTSCPDGFPIAGTEPSTGRPVPREDDSLGGGWDESGMALEVAVVLEEELEDLNMQPITMDQDSDSPHPLSPHQAAALDEAVFNNREPDLVTMVL